MSEVLKGKRIAILATDGVERRELEEPRAAVHEAGGDTELLSLETGTIDARNHDLEPAGEFRVDRRVVDADVDEFDGLLIPGGTVNADKLRSDASAVAFVHEFVKSGKPTGVICHAPWTLVEAGVAVGMTLTSYPSLRTDLRNAGPTSWTKKWWSTATSYRADLQPTFRRSARRSSEALRTPEPKAMGGRPSFAVSIAGY
jgi:protease I